jgi:hypothetical protein
MPFREHTLHSNADFFAALLFAEILKVSPDRGQHLGSNIPDVCEFLYSFLPEFAANVGVYTSDFFPLTVPGFLLVESGS